MDLTVDTAQMNALAADFGRAPAKVALQARRTTAVAARKTRDLARELSQGMFALGGYPRTITYDVAYDGVNGTVAEVGPEVGGQGSLGHLIENGTPTSGPRKHLAPAFDREVPEWLAQLERIAGNPF